MKLVCVIISVIAFLLAAFSVPIGSLALVPLGLAFLAGSFLPWKS